MLNVQASFRFRFDALPAPATFAAMLFLCQHGYEAFLERELVAAGTAVAEKGPGGVLPAVGADLGPPSQGAMGGPRSAPTQILGELAFPQVTFLAPREFKGESVNALAAQLADFFLESLRGERIEATWPCVFATVPEADGPAGWRRLLRSC